MSFQEILNSFKHSPLSMSQVITAIINTAVKLAIKDVTLETTSAAVNLKVSGSSDTLIRVAAQALIDAPLDQRMLNLSALLESGSNRIFGDTWLRLDAAQELVELIGDASRVRFSYPASIRPALIFAMQRQNKSARSIIEYAGWDSDKTLISQLATILKLDIVISDSHPWARSGRGVFDVELTMSPFGIDMSRFSDIPDATLSRLGVTGDRHGRLSAESVGIADAIEHSKGRVILAVSEGALFRAVGVEAIARAELVQSGRLQAVMAIGQSMIFQNTTINSSLLLLSPRGNSHTSIRFVNLADDQFASRRERGRLEIRPEIRWASLESRQLSGTETFARDIDLQSIIAEDFTLTAERYLDRHARDAIAQLLAKSKTIELADLVEIIRPTPLTHIEGGEYTIQEAAPSDIADDGYVSDPSRNITIDRVQFRKAFNQQLRSGDVLIAFKGNVGKAGIVSDIVLSDRASSVWTAGQSLMILRLKAHHNLSPRTLFEFLSNEVVQEHLKSLAGGSAIQTIAMKDLKNLAIPIPDMETQTMIEIDVAKRQELYEKIEQLKAEVSSMRRSGWPHLKLKAPDS